MTKRQSMKFLLSLGVAGVLLGFSQGAVASAFQLFEQNGVNAGDFGSGGAAIAEDASTSFFNPAGLTRIKNKQIVAAVDAIDIDIPFRGSNTWSLPVASLSSESSGKTNGGVIKYLPSFYYAQPLSDKMAFGFAVNSPFGLATEYESDSFVKTTATKTTLKTLDLSPNLAYQFTKDLSFGIGIDIQRADAEFDSEAILPDPYNYASTSVNRASGWGYGWHVGGLYQLTPATRIGLSYRSQVSYELQGSSTLTGTLAGEGLDGQVVSNHTKANLLLPPSATMSVFHDVNQAWALLGSLTYTKWDTVRTIGIDNVAAVDLTFTPTTINIANPVNYRNTWRLALGTNYKANEKWLFRAGVGYDQTPTNDHDRDIRVPEGDRYGFSLGTHYKATKMVGLDLGWTHIFMKPVSVSSTAVSGLTRSTANGRFHNSGDIFGGQITWDIS